VNTSKTILRALLYAAVFGCGDFADEGYEEVEIGTARQALNTPDWYGFGQETGGGQLRARFECHPDDQFTPCWIPRTKRIGVANGAARAHAGYSKAWWTARVQGALAATRAITEPHGFTFVSCSGVSCPQVTPSGGGKGMELLTLRRDASGPNATLDRYGWPSNSVPDGWPGQASLGYESTPGIKYRRMIGCSANWSDARIASSSVWGSTPAGQDAFVDLARQLLVENIIKRQQLQCLGLGTYPFQGEQYFPLTELALETLDTTVPEENALIFKPSSGLRSTYFASGQGITQFEHDLLQHFVP